MDAYPNPNSSSLLEAKSFFERLSPNGAVVLDVYRKNVATPVWLVSYRLENRFKVSISDFELLSYSIITNYEVETTSGFNLFVEYGTRTSRSIGETLRTCYDTCIKKKRCRNPYRKHDISISQCKILVNRQKEKLEVSPSQVTPEDLPIKVMYQGSNVTKQFTAKNRLTRFTFTELLQRSRVPSQYIKFFSKPEQTQSESPTNSSDSGGPSTQINRPPSYTSVGLDYQGIDDLYVKGKLLKTEVLSAAIDHLTISQFHRYPVRKLTAAGAKRKLFCIAMLKYHGLPTDESLLRVFNQFCKDNGVPSDEASCFIQVDDKGLLA